jgi:hypothetical protein
MLDGAAGGRTMRSLAGRGRLRRRTMRNPWWVEKATLDEPLARIVFPGKKAGW